MELNLTENEILSAIEKVLTENRKVLKIGGGDNNQAPVTPQPPMADSNMEMDAMPPMDPNMGGAAPDMGGNTTPMDNGQDNGGSEFDTNFDAGVEADEDSDPKKYIQQLTGKLSQSLNSFNNEQGEDAGLCKYVAAMIIKATCKFLDDKAKKELIEKINSAQNGEEELTDDSMEEPMPNETGGEETPIDDGEEPMMECGGRFMTKQDLRKMAESFAAETSPCEKENDINAENPKPFKKGPFIPKKFNK